MTNTFPTDRPVRDRCLAGSGSDVLGDRIAVLRAELGYTQQELAERIAISRVALSNLESGKSIPGERTVTLLAGIFAMEPYDLVRGTSYPPAKVDRLPVAAALYTEVDLQLALLNRDRLWVSKLPPTVRAEMFETWRRELARLRDATPDRRDRQRLADALAWVRVSEAVVEKGPTLVE